MKNLIMIILIVCAPLVTSATTYDYRYTGNPFDTFNGSGNPYTPDDYITVDILSNHLLDTSPSNIAGEVMSLTINDGRGSLAMGMSIAAVLNVWAVGADNLPASWYVELVSDKNIMASMHEIFSDHIYAIDYAAEQLANNGVYSFNMGPTGIWSLIVIPDPAPPVPEPATALLLIAGLVAATGFHYLRRNRTGGGD